MAENITHSMAGWRCAAALTLALCLSAAGQAVAWYDPMQPQGGASASAVTQQQALQPPLRLSSILLSPQRRTAVIDGRVVSVGDRVAGYRVQAIDARQVVLQAGDKQLHLPWRQPKISQPIRHETAE